MPEIKKEPVNTVNSEETVEALPVHRHLQTKAEETLSEQDKAQEIMRPLSAFDTTPTEEKTTKQQTEDGAPQQQPLASLAEARKESRDGHAQSDEYAKPKKASIGEKWWHGITYGGFGYLANLGVSVVLWDYFISGRGKPVYHAIQKGATALLKNGGASAVQAESMGSAAAKYIFSPLGGHLTMFPVKIAEDHARYLTHRLNCALDRDYKYKDLKADWNTPESELPPLADEPTRNTWGQVALRRGLGWASVIGSGMALRATKLEQPLEDWTIKLMNTGVDMTGSKSLKRLSQTPRSQRYVQLAALDSYLTGVTTIVTALTKQTFGSARDNAAADDALSIDVPGLTQSEAGRLNGHNKHTPPPGPETSGENFTDALKDDAGVTAATHKKHSSFTEAHRARQHNAQSNTQLST